MIRTRERLPGALWLPRSVLSEMEREAERTSPKETGGVLMGYWIRLPSSDGDDGEAVITAAVGPGPNADHQRFSFTPDHEYHEREIAGIYAASGREWTYLGDWHTHPGGPGKLSSRDEATITRIARAPEARAPHALMLILAAGAPWRPYAWAAAGAKRQAWWRPQPTTNLHVALFDQLP